MGVRASQKFQQACSAKTQTLQRPCLQALCKTAYMLGTKTWNSDCERSMSVHASQNIQYYTMYAVGQLAERTKAPSRMTNFSLSGGSNPTVGKSVSTLFCFSCVWTLCSQLSYCKLSSKNQEFVAQEGGKMTPCGGDMNTPLARSKTPKTGDLSPPLPSGKVAADNDNCHFE